MQNLRLCGITRHRQSYRDRPTAAFRHILGRASGNSEQPTGCGRTPTKDKLPWAPCDPARPMTCGVRADDSVRWANLARTTTAHFLPQRELVSSCCGHLSFLSATLVSGQSAHDGPSATPPRYRRLGSSCPRSATSRHRLWTGCPRTSQAYL